MTGRTTAASLAARQGHCRPESAPRPGPSKILVFFQGYSEIGMRRPVPQEACFIVYDEHNLDAHS